MNRNTKYFLYRHIRLDKNVPFYIGIGKSDLWKYTKDCKSYYGRAYETEARNKFWKRIVKKTEYRVEILWETYCREEIIEKEIEFIALYGRRDLKKGTLCNLTDGGEGMTGSLHSEETKKKIGASNKGKHSKKGKKHTEETKKKLSEIHTGKKMSKDSIEKTKLTKLSKSDEEKRLIGEKISKAHKGKPRSIESRQKQSNTMKGKSLPENALAALKIYNQNVPQEVRDKISEKKSKKILNTVTNEVYLSLEDCALKLGVNRTTLSWHINGKSEVNKYPNLKFL